MDASDFTGFPKRKRLRFQGFDYKQGRFLVTICVEDRRELFGEIISGEIYLSEVGRIVEQSWRWLAKQYSYVLLDEFVVMPNHLHGIVEMRSRVEHESRKSLSGLIGAFK